eukprot:Pgem_evm2s6399
MAQQENTLSSLLFADDASFYGVYRTPQQVQQQTQKALDNIYEWMEKWKTKISTGKTQYLVIDNSKKRNDKTDLVLQYNGQQILQQANQKLLGTDWESNAVTLIRAYKSIIRSITEYSAIAIIMMTPKDKEKLETI